VMELGFFFLKSGLPWGEERREVSFYPAGHVACGNPEILSLSLVGGRGRPLTSICMTLLHWAETVDFVPTCSDDQAAYPFLSRGRYGTCQPRWKRGVGSDISPLPPLLGVYVCGWCAPLEKQQVSQLCLTKHQPFFPQALHLRSWGKARPNHPAETFVSFFFYGDGV
jgi:hypothetical protein